MKADPCGNLGRQLLGIRAKGGMAWCLEGSRDGVAEWCAGVLLDAAWPMEARGDSPSHSHAPLQRVLSYFKSMTH